MQAHLLQAGGACVLPAAAPLPLKSRGGAGSVCGVAAGLAGKDAALAPPDAEDGFLGEGDLGELFVLQSAAQVRAESTLSSSLVAELVCSTPLRLLELRRLPSDGSVGQLRAKVLTTTAQKEVVVGWISAATSNGRPLLTKASFGLAAVDPSSITGPRCPGRARALVRRSVTAEVSIKTPKETALDQLRQLIQGMATPEEFTTAIEAARQAGVEDQEIEKAEKQLRRTQELEEIASAREQLQEAISKASCPCLRGAIARAEAARLPRVEVARANVVLEREMCKQALKDKLQALPAEIADEHLGEVKLLLSQARDAWLEDCIEYISLATAVRSADDKRNKVLQALQAVKDALQDAIDATAGLTKQSGVEALQEAKEKLSLAVRAAREAGLAEQDVAQAETRRRRIHNAVEDLKGTIRVFCRVRPMNPKERDARDLNIISQFDNMSLTVQLTREDAARHNREFSQYGRVYQPEVFSYDAVFVPGSQEEIFEDCKDLIRSALDGYNVTIFAYGQTGAGKTHTMFGSPQQEGVGPRTILELYKLIDQDSERFSHRVMGSMSELYRSELIDLLPADDRRSGDRSPARGDRSLTPRRGSNLSVGSNSNSMSELRRPRRSGVGVEVDLIEKHECASAEQLLALLRKGAKGRHVAPTAMNKESSRSHLMMTIHVVRTNKETQEKSSSKITICDLAGSERLKKSLAEGDVAKESIDINKSLTALGDVFAALTEGHSHVPYNNSKLTQVLKDALGGTSKTLMFVNCAPSGCNIEETRNTLLYARRAKKVVNQQVAK